jgi:hypothetical protein
MTDSTKSTNALVTAAQKLIVNTTDVLVSPTQKIMAALRDEELLANERVEFMAKFNDRHARNNEVFKSTQVTFYAIEHADGACAVFACEIDRQSAFSRLKRSMAPLGAHRLEKLTMTEIGPFTVAENGADVFVELMERCYQHDAAVDTILAHEYRAFAYSCDGVISIEACEVTFWWKRNKDFPRTIWTATRADARTLQQYINDIIDVTQVPGEISIVTRSISSMKDSEVLSMFKHAFLSPEERRKAREPRIDDFLQEPHRFE